MTGKIKTIEFGEVAGPASDSNKVLRNTYWLLTLTLLPTVWALGLASPVD
jgi:FtsH-binding integral membrane protein